MHRNDEPWGPKDYATNITDTICIHFYNNLYVYLLIFKHLNWKVTKIIAAHGVSHEINHAKVTNAPQRIWLLLEKVFMLTISRIINANMIGICTSSSSSIMIWIIKRIIV